MIALASCPLRVRPPGRARVLVLVVAATSLAACAPLVAMEPPSPQGPRISDLELVPDRVTAGCPVEMRFRFRATGEDVARVVAGWAVRRRTIAKPGHAAFAFEPRAVQGPGHRRGRGA